MRVSGRHSLDVDEAVQAGMRPVLLNWQSLCEFVDLGCFALLRLCAYAYFRLCARIV